VVDGGGAPRCSESKTRGRWALIRRVAPAEGVGRNLPREDVEQIARTLLKRYGGVFWRLLAAGSRLAPAVGAIC